MKFKTPKVKTRAAFVHKLVWQMVEDADRYVFEKYGIELTVVETGSTEEEDNLVGRVEPMHRERPARAVDIRTFDIAKNILDDLKEYLLKKYSHYGAISRSDGKRNLIVDKPHGTGPHWHVQITKGLSNEKVS